jgi:hypothetical protein
MIMLVPYICRIIAERHAVQLSGKLGADQWSSKLYWSNFSVRAFSVTMRTLSSG